MEMRAQCDAVAIASRAQRNGGKQITAEERIGRKKKSGFDCSHRRNGRATTRAKLGDRAEMGTHRCEQGLPYQRKEEPDEVRVDPRLRRRRSAGAEAWRAVEKLEREGGRSAGRQEEKEQAGAEDPGAGLAVWAAGRSGQCDPGRNGTACGALRQIEIRRRTVAGRSVGEGSRVKRRFRGGAPAR